MIHETAIVHPKAEVGENVEIGAFSIIRENVTIGSGTWIGPHVVIDPYVDIGPDRRIFQYALFSFLSNKPTLLRTNRTNVIDAEEAPDHEALAKIDEPRRLR